MAGDGGDGGGLTGYAPGVAVMRDPKTGDVAQGHNPVSPFLVPARKGPGARDPTACAAGYRAAG